MCYQKTSAIPPLPPPPFTVCRQCGCTNDDACKHPDYDVNCSWAEPDLCNFCKYTPGQATRYSIIHQAELAAGGAFAD